jgi:hypothetical protein
MTAVLQAVHSVPVHQWGIGTMDPARTWRVRIPQMGQGFKPLDRKQLRRAGFG